MGRIQQCGFRFHGLSTDYRLHFMYGRRSLKGLRDPDCSSYYGAYVQRKFN